MTDALVQRLEAVASRLEKAADNLGSGSGSASSASASASASAMGGSNMTSPGLIAWRRFVATEVAAFVAACAHFAELKKPAEWITTITSTLERLIAASLQSKKPTAAELSTFLADLTTVSGEVSKAQDNRSPFGAQLKAFEESLSGFMWVTVSPPEALPKELAQGGLEAADFYLTRVLTESKKLTGAEAANRAAFASTLKALLTQQVTIVREHFATGLSWNAKGGALSAASASASSAAAPAPAAAGAAAGAAGAAVGRGALFSQLSSIDVTAGLKKVTSDMKTKNLKDVPALEPKKPAAAPAPKAEPVAAAPKEPKVYNSKGTWFVENYTGGVVVVDQVELKENVYILKCKNTQVSIPVKCKSIQVDSCTKTDVQFKNVVSIFEIFNSQRINIYCDEHVPSVAVDKCNGVGVHLTRESVATPPQLITSSISEMNLIVPGKTDEDDPIEIPLPEQYLTVFKDGKLVTECVAHSAN